VRGPGIVIVNEEKDQRRKTYWAKHKHRPHKIRKGGMEPYKREKVLVLLKGERG
jgi:hypothetical protein